MRAFDFQEEFKKIEQHFERIDKRFDRLDAMAIWGIGIMVTGFSGIFYLLSLR